MDTEHIIIIVLLVFIILFFISIVLVVVVSIAKINRLVKPLRTAARVIRRAPRLLRTGSRTKQQFRQLKKDVTKVFHESKPIRTAIESDIRTLIRDVAAKLPSSKIGQMFPNVSQLLQNGVHHLTCAQWDELWSHHINLTYYYGTLALKQNIDQVKMDYVANQLLQLQKQMAQRLCPTSANLLKLLQDHIGIVANMATQWRQRPNGFDPSLVQSWYANAKQTTDLLQGDSELEQAYKKHLDDTAAYLTSLAASDSTKSMQQLQMALLHVPDLARLFCAHEGKCSK